MVPRLHHLYVVTTWTPLLQHWHPPRMVSSHNAESNIAIIDPNSTGVSTSMHVLGTDRHSRKLTRTRKLSVCLSLHGSLRLPPLSRHGAYSLCFYPLINPALPWWDLSFFRACICAHHDCIEGSVAFRMHRRIPQAADAMLAAPCGGRSRPPRRNC